MKHTIFFIKIQENISRDKGRNFDISGIIFGALGYAIRFMAMYAIVFALIL